MNSRSHVIRYQHNFEHKHDHRHINPYGIFATRLADASLVEVIAQLNEAAHQVNLSGLLFPNGVNFQNQITLQNDEKKLQAASVEQETMELWDFAVILKKGIESGRLGFDCDKTREYFEYLFSPLKEKLKKESTQQQNNKKNQLIAWGELILPPVNLAQVMELSLKELDILRKAVASSCFPLGLGFRSAYEYRYWLCKYLLKARQLPFSEADLELLHSYRLRQQLEHQFPEDASQVIQVLYQLLRYQKLAFDKKGVRGKCPRSTRRLMKRYGCSARQAAAVISLYRLLPTSPNEDLRYNEHYEPHVQIIPMEEFCLRAENDSRIVVYWSNAFSDITAHLTSEAVESVISAIRQCADIKFRDERELEEGLVRLHESSKLEEQINVLDLTTQFLLNKGEEKLVRRHSEIENKQLTPYEKAKIRMSKLKNTLLRYERLQEAINLKPQIVEYVVQYQQKFILTGDIEKLEPLTKSDIVRGLSYIPSGIKVGNNDEKSLQNIGRRIERYIKKMNIEYPDHRIQPLDSLIPGHGGVKDFAGHHVLDVVIKSYIRELIEGEPRNSPLSDQKISYLLAEEYAVPVQRTLVKKYRLAMGIGSSQSRDIQ